MVVIRPINEQNIVKIKEHIKLLQKSGIKQPNDKVE